MMKILIYFGLIVLGGVIGIIIYSFFKKRTEKESQCFDSISNQINEIQKTILDFFKDSQEIKTTTKILLDQSEKFNFNFGKINEFGRQIQDSLKEVSSFQNLFKSPKLRGRWGELYLEHLLSEVLSREQYQIQYQFKNGNIVDAIIKLPDKRILPIDAKFPVDYFEKINETENASEKSNLISNFITIVKKEIDDISKKYILPQENTTDFALMYIPAESIFYSVISLKEANLYEYARTKKVIFASPSTLYSLLKTILAIQREIQVVKRGKEILKRLNQIINDVKKLQENFDKLGKYLIFARNSYEESQRKLNHFIERSKRLIETSEDENIPLGSQENLKNESSKDFRN